MELYAGFDELAFHACVNHQSVEVLVANLFGRICSHQGDEVEIPRQDLFACSTWCQANRVFTDRKIRQADFKRRGSLRGHTLIVTTIATLCLSTFLRGQATALRIHLILADLRLSEVLSPFEYLKGSKSFDVSESLCLADSASASQCCKVSGGRTRRPCCATLLN